MPTKESNPHPKISGTVLAEFKGLTIYGKLKKAKRKGKTEFGFRFAKVSPSATGYLNH
jgi:hypothetical protein